MSNFGELLDAWERHTQATAMVFCNLAQQIIETEKENAPIKAEKLALDFKNKLDGFPEKHSGRLDTDGLRFLRVLVMDFLPIYYQVRGMAIDAREGKSVDEKTLLRAIIVLESWPYIFRANMRNLLGFSLTEEF
jgi:hypothetical protein